MQWTIPLDRWDRLLRRPVADPGPRDQRGRDREAVPKRSTNSPGTTGRLDPDVILLPKSMYKTDADVAAFTKDPRFAGLSAVKNNRVVVVDDVIVTRPGPRIGDGLQILEDAIHPPVTDEH